MEAPQNKSLQHRLIVIAQSIAIGMLVLLAGTIPRNILFSANLHYFTKIPWAVPLIAIFLWFFWWYLNGGGSPESTAAERRTMLRAGKLPVIVWAWALFAGVLGIVTLILALRLLNTLVVLPEQQLPDFTGVPKFTVLTLLLAAAPVAGIVEEAAFRGYMQGPIERHCGLPIAILITGTMFAVAHLDFTLILWPYYVAVAAIYGTVTYLTRSILPSIVLHTGGNIYSNMDLWLHGKAEWQAVAKESGIAALNGPWWLGIGTVLLLFVTVWAYWRLAKVVNTAGFSR
ncbi:MAG TPA: type II CAAX endopeptidase family protein [Chitinophaga sp.]